MGRVSTNTIGVNAVRESALGTAGTTGWFKLEPNDVPTFGAEIETVARSPISTDRQRKKGTTVDLDSAVEIEADLTMSMVDEFTEAFLFADYNGFQIFRPSAVTSTGYTVASGGAIANGLLIYVRGCTTSGNNGLKLTAGTSTATEIKTTGLTAEASLTNALLEVAGVRGASGDITMDSNGDLNSTTLDFTTLNLTVGQWIKIGGATSGLQFATAANNGYARIEAIAATKLTLQKWTFTPAVDNGSGKTIDIYFGRFGRNVDTTDGDYAEISYHFEGVYPNLGAGGVTEYEYAIGNFLNEMSFELPLSDKAGLTCAFIGTDTEDITTSRKTGASSALSPLKTSAVNTTSQIARLRFATTLDADLTTYFKELTLTVNNNVTPEKVLGSLGAAFVNAGIFEVDIEAQILFTAKEPIIAIRDNETVSFDMRIKNDDGGVIVDIPSLTLGDGSKEFPTNETVLVNLAGQAFRDTTLGYTMSVSLFPYLP